MITNERAAELGQITNNGAHVFTSTWVAGVNLRLSEDAAADGDRCRLIPGGFCAEKTDEGHYVLKHKERDRRQERTWREAMDEGVPEHYLLVEILEYYGLSEPHELMNPCQDPQLLGLYWDRLGIDGEDEESEWPTWAECIGNANPGLDEMMWLQQRAATLCRTDQLDEACDLEWLLRKAGAPITDEENARERLYDLLDALDDRLCGVAYECFDDEHWGESRRIIVHSETDLEILSRIIAVASGLNTE